MSTGPAGTRPGERVWTLASAWLGERRGRCSRGPKLPRASSRVRVPAAGRQLRQAGGQHGEVEPRTQGHGLTHRVRHRSRPRAAERWPGVEGNVGLPSPARRVAAVGRGGAGKAAWDVPVRPCAGGRHDSPTDTQATWTAIQPRSRTRPRVCPAAGREPGEARPAQGLTGRPARSTRSTAESRRTTQKT